MICPTCEANNQTSTITVGEGHGTLAGVNSFYDRDGNFHVHDSNINTVEYTCSNGHTWTQDWYASCAVCGWHP